MDKYKALFENGKNADLLKLSDGTLLTDDGQSFDIHKVILARKSSFFKALFCTDLDHEDKRNYRISCITGDCLSDILIYMYNKVIDVNEQNIAQILIAADYFGLKKLYLKVKSQVKTAITVENCITLLNVFYKLNEEEMKTFCYEFTKVRFEKIMSSKINGLEDVVFDLLMYILSDRNLNVRSERTVFRAIVFWVEANAESRERYTVNLLSTLALQEVDENLATEILNHNIVSSFIKDIKTSDRFHNNFDILSNFLFQVASDKPNNYRSPQKLNIISKFVPDEEKLEIYTSYDETLELWRKITQKHSSVCPTDMIAISDLLYIMYNFGQVFESFNLKTMEWKPLDNIRVSENELILKILLSIEHFIYILVEDKDEDEGIKYYLKMYNTISCQINRTFSIDSSLYTYISATPLGNNIFFVAIDNHMSEHIAMSYDTASGQWSSLSSPGTLHYAYDLITCQGKIYLIAVEGFKPRHIYDPELNIWNRLPYAEHLYGCSTEAIVLNDQLVINDISYKQGLPVQSQIIRWDNEKQSWEVLGKHTKIEDLKYVRACQTDDSDIIKVITKLNRLSEVELKPCEFAEDNWISYS